MKEIILIDKIKKMVGGPAKGLIEGIGDDCAVLEYSADKYLLWGADMLVQGTHFTSEAGLENIGWKAVAVNISDIAAMGGVPKFITVSLGLPDKDTSRAVNGLYKGIKKICGIFGVRVVGGDLNRSEKLVIDVNIIGEVERKRLVKRSGARPGDVILVTGPIRNGKKDHLRFMPRVKESRYLVGNYSVSSMMDTSDGIGPDLNRICRASGAGARIHAACVPLSDGTPLEDALYYGESFELIFTMPPRDANELLLNTCGRGNGCFYVIGEITAPGDGVTVKMPGGRTAGLKTKGFCHLS
jgi:thiamine-monophosphate kinase